MGSRGSLDQENAGGTIAAVEHTPSTPLHRIRIVPKFKFTAELGLTVNAPSLTAKQWVIYCPLPPNDLWSQTIEEVEVIPSNLPRSVVPVPYSYTGGGQRPAANFLLVHLNTAQFPHMIRSINIKFRFKGTLNARFLEEGAPATVKEPDPRGVYVASLLLPRYNHENTVFREWLAKHSLHRGAVMPSDVSDISYARRVFSHIVNTFTYKYPPGNPRTLESLCTHQTTDCGGMAMVFVAVMRAHAIPARCLVGRWAQDAGQHSQCHVKAEFIARGVGWIPVDLSSAVVFGKTAEHRMQWFGRDQGRFVTLHTDFDYEVDTLHFGVKEVVLMQGIPYWVTGQGGLSDATSEISWKVQTTQLEELENATQAQTGEVKGESTE